jgi:diacylglycerol kinase family enzyme
VQIRLVVNPHASTTTPQRCRLVEAALAARHDVSVVETERRDHATELTRSAIEDGVDAVAVLGGDGTLNEVANAMVGTRVVLFALPGGGTNVFCRTLGLPDDPVAAAEQLLEAHDRGSTRRIGVGTIDGTGPGGRDRRHFVFHTGVGWDAAVVAVVERHSSLKRRLGHLLFVYAGLRTFLTTYDRRRPHFRLELDDGTKVHDAFFAIVMNSDPYTFVGHRPFVVDPTNTADTAFTVVALRSMRVRHFLAVMAQALRGRGLSERPTLVLRRDVTGVTVRRTTSLPYQVDGDHLGDAAELRMHHRPDALSVVVPDTDGSDTRRRRAGRRGGDT